VIDVIFGDAERPMPGQPYNRSSMLDRLSTAGIPYRVVEKPSANSVALFFGPLNSTSLSEVAPSARGRLVVVDEGSRMDGEKAELARRTAGLLGLVESSAWRKWKAGALVAGGLFGQGDVAARAGLTAKGSIGLQPDNDVLELSDVLARFLKVAVAAGANLQT